MTDLEFYLCVAVATTATDGLGFFEGMEVCAALDSNLNKNSQDDQDDDDKDNDDKDDDDKDDDDKDDDKDGDDKGE